MAGIINWLEAHSRETVRWEEGLRYIQAEPEPAMAWFDKMASSDRVRKRRKAAAYIGPLLSVSNTPVTRYFVYSLLGDNDRQVADITRSSILDWASLEKLPISQSLLDEASSVLPMFFEELPEPDAPVRELHIAEPEWPDTVVIPRLQAG